MALSPTLVRVPGTGELSLAPPGTPEPPDPTTPLPAAWTGLGLSTEDGVTIRRAVERTGTTHWQQTTPARFIYTSQEFGVSSVFQETKAVVLGAYFGGMVFAETVPGSKKYRAEISSIPRGDERALCVDWVDQISATEIYHHRLYVPRAEVSETQDAQWTRTQEARWGISFAALAPATGTTLAVWLTDDPAVMLAPPSGGTLTTEENTK